jgi:hypothetical protein
MIWQPPDTVPQDGTRIMLCFDKPLAGVSGRQIVFARWGTVKDRTSITLRSRPHWKIEGGPRRWSKIIAWAPIPEPALAPTKCETKGD